MRKEGSAVVVEGTVEQAQDAFMLEKSDELNNNVIESEPLQSTIEILKQIKETEKKLMRNVKTSYQTRYIKIPMWNSQIYTLTIHHENVDITRVPIVLLHGFAGAVGLWATVLDGLVKTKHIIHAFDLLGFGSSSRPKFSTDPAIAEKELVQSIEEWRETQNIEQMIFVGHSFGGYLGYSYAISHPDRVRHLVLVDPWGFPENNKLGKSHANGSKMPLWAQMIHPIYSKFNPMALSRVLGLRKATRVMKKFRPEMQGWYQTDAIYDYNYLNNAQKPSAEVAFKNMNILLGQVKRPMIHRFHLLDPKVPITFMYGKESWVDPSAGYTIKYKRNESYVKIHMIENAGHQIFAEEPLRFLKVMHDLLDKVEKNEDLEFPRKSRSFETIDDLRIDL